MESEETVKEVDSKSSRMKDDWNDRARVNAKWYITTIRLDLTDEDFDASGRPEVEKFILGDPLLTGPREGRDLKSQRMLEIARERLAGLRSVLAELVRTSVTIEANANDEGHLYGSVGAAEISRSLKQQDLSVAADQIILQGPLKEVGLYTVKVRLAAEVEGDLKVWVVPSSGEAGSK